MLDAGPQVGLVMMHGSQEAAFTEIIFPALDNVILRDGAMYFFADTAGVTDYEPEYRERFTKWLLKQRPKLLGAHVLVKSPVVVMGIALANIALGGLIRSYRDPAIFEQQLQQFAKPK